MQLILCARALCVVECRFVVPQGVVENSAGLLGEREHETLTARDRIPLGLVDQPRRPDLVTLASGEHQLRNADPPAGGRVDDGIDFLDQRFRCVQLPFEHEQQREVYEGDGQDAESARSAGDQYVSAGQQMPRLVVEYLRRDATREPWPA